MIDHIRIREKPEPYCPDCGAKMILRRPPAGKTWRPFWGCNQFPACQGKRQIDENGLAEEDNDLEYERFRDRGMYEH